MLDILTILMLLASVAGLVAFGFLLVSSFKRSVLWGLGVLLVPFVALFYGYKFWSEVKKPFLAYVGSNALCLVLAGYLFTQIGGMQAVEMASKINDGTMTEQDAAQFMVSGMGNMEKLGAGSKEEMLAQMRADPNLSEEDVKQFEAMFNQIEAVASGEQDSFVNGDWQKQEGKDPLQLAMISPDEANGSELESKIADIEAKMAQLEGEQQAREEADAVSADDTVMGLPMPEYVESPIKEPVEQFVKKSSGAVSVADARHYLGDIFRVTTKEGVTREATLVDTAADKLEFQRRASGGTLTFKLARTEIKQLVLK